MNDLDSPDCPMTIATSQGYLHYPPPAIHFTPPTSTAPQTNPSLMKQQSFVPLPSWFWPILTTTGSDLGVFHTDPSMAVEVPEDVNTDFAADSVSPILAAELDVDTGRPSQLAELQFPESSSPAPMDISPRPLHDDVFGDSSGNDVSTSGRGSLEEGDILEHSHVMNGTASESMTQIHEHGQGSPTVVGAPWDVGGPVSEPTSTRPMESSRAGLADTTPPSVRIPIPSSTSPRQDSGIATPTPEVWPMSAFPTLNSQILGGGPGGIPPFQNFLPVGDYTGWELPFLHGWVQGQQAQTGIGPSAFSTGVPLGGMASQQTTQEQQQNNAVSVASVAMAAAMAAARAAARAGAGMVGAASAGLGAGIGAQIGAGKYCSLLVLQ